MKVFQKLGFIILLVLFYEGGTAQSRVNLKGSGYYMIIPKSYTVKKKQGIDYKSFYLIEKAAPDSSKNFVMFGCCVGTIGESLESAYKIDSVKAIILGQEVLWKIYTWDSSYLAETLISFGDGEKVAFGIKTKNRGNVNLLISSFGTLRKRR